MIERTIRGSARAPLLSFLIALTASVLGVLAYQRLQRDVFPDLSAPVFNVIVQNAAMGAEELETTIAIPLETALSGLPGARRVRSVHQLGVSQVTVEFEPDADYYRSRQFVAERVAQVAPSLPPGTEPPLLSSLTGRLNEVIELTLEAKDGRADLMSLRDLAEFELRNRLLAVPGVSAVERLGGYLRQLQVQLDPDRMVARGVTLDEVMHAVEGANQSASGGFIVQGPMEWNVRALGRAEGADDLRTTVVSVRGAVPVTIGDVADVREAPAVRRGLAHRLDGEIVSLRIVKQFGADTGRVSSGVRTAIADLQRGLPPGVSLTVSYDQADLVESALSGVSRAVLLGAVFVVLVLCGLLGDLRAAALVTLTIPLSIAIAGLLLERAGIGLNTMTLGGLAIAVALLADASIIVVENVVHRIQGTHDAASRRAHAIEAAVEVGRPIAYATAIVVAVFLPLFGVQGIEGRMYGPLAAAVIASMVGALLLALTLTPTAAALVLRPRRAGAAEDVWLVRALKRVYAPALDGCMRHAWRVRVLSLLLTVPALILALQLGRDFMPELDEGALILNTIIPAEASLEQVDLLNHRVEDVLRTFPEVTDVVRRTGRSERTEDPMAHTYSDVLVVLDPQRTRSNEEVTAAMREALHDVPGVSVLFTTPLMMRIDEGLGGTPADLSVRIFGSDLDRLAGLAARTRELMSTVRGLEDVRAEQLSGVPQLRIQVDRAAAARVGLTPGEIIRALRIGMVGEEVSQIVRGQRRFDLVVRLQEGSRADVHALRKLLIDGHDGTRVPLAQVAKIEETVGVAAIRREAGSRRIAVEANVVGRDLRSSADDVRARLAAELKLPTGYFIEVGGRVESEARASEALLSAIVMSLLCVFALLYLALGSVADTLVILATLPDAFVGGIVALWLFGESWNVSSLVGLIGLFGIAVQNGLVLITQTRALLAQGRSFDDALREACIGRVRPKLMTAGTAILGLLPLLVLRLHGTEIERPLAIVMVGGLVSSTLFTLLALPTFYALVHHLRDRVKPAATGAAALLSVLILATPTGSARAEDEPWPEAIDWPVLVRLIERRSARADVLKARVESAGSEIAVAEKIPNPDLSYLGFGRTRGTPDAINGSQHQIQLEQALPAWGQRRARGDAARAAVDAARASKRALLLELLGAGRHLFVALSVADARLAVHDGALERIADARSLIAGRVRVGMLSQYDLVRAELEEVRLRGARDLSLADLSQVQARLAELVGAPTWAPHAAVPVVALQEDGAATLPPVAHEVPPLVEAQAEARVAQLKITLAERERIPAPTLTAGALITTDYQSTSAVGGLKLPLPAFDTGKADIDKARASHRASRAFVQQVTRQTAARYHGALRTRTASREAYQRLAQGVPDRLRRLREMARVAYEAGTVNILVLLDAVRAQTDAELESLDALEAWLRADADARIAGGLLLEQAE